MPEIKYLPEQRRFQIDIDGLEAGYIGYTVWLIESTFIRGAG